MLLYPDIQAKAQAEIDAIVGNDRLPRFDDREHLPYINPLALEVSRCIPSGPLGELRGLRHFYADTYDI